MNNELEHIWKEAAVA